MNNNQIWIKCNNLEEIEILKTKLIQMGFKYDFCIEVLTWPIAIDNELKVAFSVDKPSYCGAYINSGRKIFSLQDIIKDM